jgi:NADPH-ferrihemoprotein reductase
MDVLEPLDRHFLQLLTGGTAFCLLRKCVGYLRTTPVEPLLLPKSTEKQVIEQNSLKPTRNIGQALTRAHKHCVVFYGSQTGTAERLASQFAKEAFARFGLRCLIADLSDYDYESLLSLKDQVAIFFLATYGEGEATDNGVAFKRYLDNVIVSESNGESMLRYAGFGLGNSSYQYYNEMIKYLDVALSSQGGRRIGTIGFGDDGLGTLDADYITWKQAFLPALAHDFNLEEHPFVYEPSFYITQTHDAPSDDTFCGEPNIRHLRNRIRGPYTLKNPYPAPLTVARQLCPNSQRQFLHLEVDLNGSTLAYEAGDHLTVRPANSNEEVDRMLHVFGWTAIRDYQIHVASADPGIKVPVPSPTTLDAVLRYYLDICGPISRQLLASLAHFVTDDNFRARLHSLCTNADGFEKAVAIPRLNLAQFLEKYDASKFVRQVPYSVLLENIPLLKPRYYSISSSPTVSKGIASITTVIETSFDHSPTFKGVATHYLLDLAQPLLSNPSPTQSPTSTSSLPSNGTHQTRGPRDRHLHPTASITIRHSSFKLPRDVSIPIIMIGPGTGIAPFRGFVQSRLAQFRSGKPVGRTLLFYGCRRANEDYLYRDEWDAAERVEGFGGDGGVFAMHTAFSREKGKPKLYVQDLMREAGVATELRELVLRRSAVVYVCGDARRMAVDVWKAMRGVVAADERFRGDEDAAGAAMEGIRREGRWLEDVW